MDLSGIGGEALLDVGRVEMAYVCGFKVGPIRQAYRDGIACRLGVLDVGACGVAKVVGATGISYQCSVV